jgi:hypothetical protein
MTGFSGTVGRGRRKRRRFRSRQWFPPGAKRLIAGLATVLGIKPLGFFIPCRYAAEATANSATHFARVEEIFADARENFDAVIGDIEACAPALRAIAAADQPAEGVKPHFRQGLFPRLDAAAAYALARRYKPARIVEIGTGHSTRFLATAIAEGGFDCRLTTIDPAPRRVVERPGIEIIEATVQEAGTAPFDDLAPGDFLVVDSSHILMPGSDVDMVLNTILPRAPRGLLVHFHDILLPDAYPREWNWRAYNEQNAVAALLTSGDAFEVLFASHYAATRMQELLAPTVIAEIALPDGVFETSLWLRKR